MIAGLSLEPIQSSRTHTLQKYAMVILGLTCSTSICERKWNTFQQLHNWKWKYLMLMRKKKQWRLLDTMWLTHLQMMTTSHNKVKFYYETWWTLLHMTMTSPYTYNIIWEHLLFTLFLQKTLIYLFPILCISNFL